MQLTSAAFKDGQNIPTRYTGDGENISPPLAWSRVPDNCKGYALICEDTDAPQTVGKEYPFVHWIIYNISPSVSSLPEGLMAKATLTSPVSADQGLNSFGYLGYGGPMPPVGHGPHRYLFKLYALNAAIGAKPGLTKKELMKAIDIHVIVKAQLNGMYERMIARRAA